MKNGSVITSADSNATYRFEAENTRRRIVFDSLSLEDGGNYTVRIENQNGVAEHQFKLDVLRKEKPKFDGQDESTIQRFEVTEGDHVLVSFQLSGKLHSSFHLPKNKFGHFHREIASYANLEILIRH